MQACPQLHLDRAAHLIAGVPVVHSLDRTLRSPRWHWLLRPHCSQPKAHKCCAASSSRVHDAAIVSNNTPTARVTVTGAKKVPAIDAAGLLQALVQLASRNTVVIGSHQAYALLEALEPQLPAQLHTVPTENLSSGLWAMARLQLQPSQELIATAAQHLLQPRPMRSSTGSKLSECSARTLGTLCYAMNFFTLRYPDFWAAAAAAALHQLDKLKPSAISNLLQGLAASGWVVNLAAEGSTAGPQVIRPGRVLAESAAVLATVTAADNTQLNPAAGSSKQGTAHNEVAVSQLLQSVEAYIVSQPQLLTRWRMRDISQLAQAYALTGYRCGLLFATIANHLLDQEHGPAAASSMNNTTGSSHQQGWNVQSHALSINRKERHKKGQGPGRLMDCRAADAVGLAWAYVHSFCTHRALLQELAAVVTAKARQLHAADCCRLLWAYATAGVVDVHMLAAVTSAVAEEMHGVLPRTAAGAVWCLAQMRFEAPAFMEAAMDRLAACLEATPCDSSQGTALGPTAGTAGTSRAGLTPASANYMHSPAASAAAGSASSVTSETPSVLQQLYNSPPAAMLSDGSELGGSCGYEFSMLGILRQQTHARHAPQHPPQHSMQSGGQQQQQQQAQHWLLQVNDAKHEPQKASHSSIGSIVPANPCNNDLLDSASTWDTEWYTDTPASLEQHQQHTLKYLGGDLYSCSPRDVAEAVYACGRLHHYNASFFRELRGKFRDMLPLFGDRELVHVLWGLTRLRLYDGRNMDIAANEMLKRAARLPAPLVALTAWAYASLRHNSTQLFDALAARAIQLHQKGWLKPTDASHLVKAAAKLLYRNEALFKACAEVIWNTMPRLGDSIIASCLWAFAVAGHYDEELFADGFTRLSVLPPAKARPLLLLQLFQALTLMQDAYATGLLGPAARVSPALAVAASRQWMFSNRRSPSRRSRFQWDVARVLQEQLCLVVQEEALTNDGLFSIDVAVIWQGRRVAVEVDGPEHYTANQPYQLLGNSMAKRRCLHARGWVVVGVPWFVWASLTQQQQRRGGSKQPLGEQKSGLTQEQLEPADIVNIGVDRAHSSPHQGRGNPTIPCSGHSPGSDCNLSMHLPQAVWLKAALDAATAAAYVPLQLQQQGTSLPFV